VAGETTLSDIVSAKVGQKYALDKIAGNTRTHGTKSWPPGFYKADLGAKTLYFISLIAASDIKNTKQGAVVSTFSSQ